MTDKYIMAIDEGTTSTRAIIFDHAGHKVADSQREFPQYFPQPGWVEHNANEIWNAVLSTIANAFIESGIKPVKLVVLELRINGKQPSFGTSKLACQSITQSCGNHGKPRRLLRSWLKMVMVI